jgi:aspartate dehydrogenase
MRKHRVSIIGCGAIGSAIVDAYSGGLISNAKINTVLVRHIYRYKEEAHKLREVGIHLTDKVDELIETSPDLVVEVAGQEAVAQYGLRVLRSGSSLLVSSVGAFTDDNLYSALQKAASENTGNLYLAAGALPGTDWVQGASYTDVFEVNIIQNKPVNSWVGTPAEKLLNLETVEVPVTFFSGTAREAASIFSKSSNITAMLALCTIGLDKVKVSLIADPDASSMQTDVTFRGNAGELKIQWHGIPSPRNPSTSIDVGLNIVKALNNICSSVKLGV